MSPTHDYSPQAGCKTACKGGSGRLQDRVGSKRGSKHVQEACSLRSSVGRQAISQKACNANTCRQMLSLRCTRTCSRRFESCKRNSSVRAGGDSSHTGPCNPQQLCSRRGSEWHCQVLSDVCTGARARDCMCLFGCVCLKVIARTLGTPPRSRCPHALRFPPPARTHTHPCIRPRVHPRMHPRTHTRIHTTRQTDRQTDRQTETPPHTPLHTATHTHAHKYIHNHHTHTHQTTPHTHTYTSTAHTH
jgi:hypothetical protein